MMSFFDIQENGYIVRIKVIPNAACAAAKEIVEDADGRLYLKVTVNAVPEKGKANKELVVWLAKQLKISKSSFSILSGESERFKKILIASAEPKIAEALSNLVKGNNK